MWTTTKHRLQEAAFWTVVWMMLPYIVSGVIIRRLGLRRQARIGLLEPPPCPNCCPDCGGGPARCGGGA